MRADQALSIHDLARAAARRLPPSVHGYVSGGSEDQQALHANRDAFAAWAFRPQALVDVSARSQAVDLFGRRLPAPLGISPMGVAALCHHDGDLALARAAQAAGLPFVLSAASTVPLEEVMAAAPDSWYQAYLPADTAVIGPLLERIERAGVRTLVVTVDVPVASVREHELRNGFSVPMRPNLRLIAGGLARPRWLAGTFARTLLTRGVPHFENFTAVRGGPIVTARRGDHRSGRAAMSWREIDWMRRHWPHRMLLKGILRGEDARRAQDLGLDGVFVSNHGGRQLDGTQSPLQALPEVVAAAPGLTVLLDGGVRRGTDVLKALALGARAVFVGRPAMWGLAVGGEAGVGAALALLRREIDIDLALLGCPDVARLDPSFLVPAVPARAPR